MAGLNINHQGRHRERLEVRPRPKSGRAATLRRMASNAPVWAARCCRQNVEVRIVTDSEKKSMFTRTSDSRHTSPAVTPPTITQTVRHGNMASRQ